MTGRGVVGDGELIRSKRRCQRVNQNVHGSMMLPEFRELYALNYDRVREKTSGRAGAAETRGHAHTHGAHTGRHARTAAGQHDPHGPSRIGSPPLASSSGRSPRGARGRGPRAPTAKARHTTRRARARQRSPINSPKG